MHVHVGILIHKHILIHKYILIHQHLRTAIRIRIMYKCMYINETVSAVIPVLVVIPIEKISQNPLLALVLTSRGGHLGFVDGPLINDVGFTERLFMEYAKGIFGGFCDKRSEKLQSEPTESLETSN